MLSGVYDPACLPLPPFCERRSSVEAARGLELVSERGGERVAERRRRTAREMCAGDEEKEGE
jgi:hypothetical protein